MSRCAHQLQKGKRLLLAVCTVVVLSTEDTAQLLDLSSLAGMNLAFDQQFNQGRIEPQGLLGAKASGRADLEDWKGGALFDGLRDSHYRTTRRRIGPLLGVQSLQQNPHPHGP